MAVTDEFVIYIVFQTDTASVLSEAIDTCISFLISSSYFILFHFKFNPLLNKISSNLFSEKQVQSSPYLKSGATPLLIVYIGVLQAHAVQEVSLFFTQFSFCD